MIFLIEYSRREGRIIRYETFDDQDRERAANLRLDIELELNRTRIEHEVVLLEAASEKALRRTHRRYFENASQISSTG
jgi:hypothetical protein